MTAPGNFPVATSLSKNSVMRSSFCGEGAGAWLAADVPVQIANDKAAQASRPVREPAVRRNIWRAGMFMFFAPRIDLPENFALRRTTNTSSDRSPCGQSPHCSNGGHACLTRSAGMTR